MALSTSDINSNSLVSSQIGTIANDSVRVTYNSYDLSSLGFVDKPEATESTEEEDTEPNLYYSSQGLDQSINAKVRRPYRGISIKKESYASIAVVKNRSTFSSKEVRNSSSATTVAFTSNFLINSVSESRTEKHQPVPTFGKDYVYFFGEQPRQMTFNATLLNSDNFRWEEEWWYNYEHYFRGTRLAASSETVRIRLDESIIYGYMITCTTNKDSNNPHVVTLSFTVHVTDVVSTRPSAIGSHKIIDYEGNSYGNVDMNPFDVGTNNPTFAIGKESQSIRAYNIDAYQKDQENIGSVTRMKQYLANTAVGEFVSSTTAGIQNAIDFIYGRNLVLPADAAYAQFSVGNPSFAEGSSAKAKLDAGANSINVKQTSVTTSRSTLGSGSYTDNFDEYPYSAVIGTVEKQKSTESNKYTPSLKVLQEISNSFNIPIDQLKGDSNDAFPSTYLDNIRKSRNKSLAQKAAFGAFQIAVASQNSSVRKQAYSEGKYKVFPNEVFAPGLLSIQYSS